MTDHDHSYKLLLSHRQLVEDLLRGFVQEGWVGQVDFSTLERVGASYVSDDLRELEDDIGSNTQGEERALIFAERMDVSCRSR